MRILKAGALYFALVFCAGFVLGIGRTLWMVPRLGARAAELAETPVMLAVSFLAARWVVRRLGVPPQAAGRLAVGGLALGLMLVAEFSLVLFLRGLAIREYFESRDPVAAIVYYLALGIFGVMPLLVGRRPGS